MSASTIIDPSLFDLLANVKTQFNTGDDSDFALRMNRIAASLVAFIKNFFIGFFKNAYGIKIDSVTEEDLEIINRHFRFKTSKPQDMIDLYREAIKVIDEIKEATYDNPPSEGELLDAFDVFVHNLLNSAIDAFIELGAVVLYNKTKQVFADLWK